MASDSRARMIDGAVRLLAQKGLQATSFADVLELTKTPRGSIYHHFPNGKDQLIASALDTAGQRVTAVLGAHDGESAEEVTEFFLGLWKSLLVSSQFTAGCSVLAVTVATDSPDLLSQASAVFRDWRGTLATLLEHGGLSAHAAQGFAALLVASTEGAVVMSRAELSLAPFELVSDGLRAHLTQLRAAAAQLPPGRAPAP